MQNNKLITISKALNCTVVQLKEQYRLNLIDLYKSRDKAKGKKYRAYDYDNWQKKIDLIESIIK